MKVLVTGAKGFIGRNLVAELNLHEGTTVLPYDRDSDPSLLIQYCKEADFVCHLAGVNRPKEEAEFFEGNVDFTSELLTNLRRYNNSCPVLFSSSQQAALDNVYGMSKKFGEDIIFKYSQETGAKALVYRFPNVFGKWCRPNYNSVVATFCNNIAHDLPITVNDPNIKLTLVYIDDILTEIKNALMGNENRVGDFCEVPISHLVTLGELTEMIYSFRDSREERQIPNMADELTKKMYSTYLSYLPTDKFSYPLKMNIDNRGSFTEFIKTPDRGQVSVNISKPGIVKGNHWHHTKNEKFLVVSGRGIIRLRKIDTHEIIEYEVSGDMLEVIDIPTGYTHNIENMGTSDMVTVMWANEHFDPNKPDTHYLEV